MSNEYWKLIAEIIPGTYAKQAEEANQSKEKEILTLLRHKRIPDIGWDDDLIEVLMGRIASMDSNNFSKSCGLGEREARFASELVRKRHYGMGHGIGRSGDLVEAQPKAAGSSLIYKLTNFLVKDLFKLMEISSPIECMVVPLATSMSLSLCFQALRSLRPYGKYIIWSRIDQKACFKSILAAGFVPLIVSTVQRGDQLHTDLNDIERKLSHYPLDEILCVMSTTSCFAPRACDEIEYIARLCEVNRVPHVINNAYGLQSRYIMKRVHRAHQVGRVDIIVQSTDKNLMVPVGGAIIASFDGELLQAIAETYPGRASGAPITDVFITLLSLGKSGYLQLVMDRERAFLFLQHKLTELSNKVGEKVLATENNPISLSITLDKILKEDLTKLGAKLFIRNVSGTRVVNINQVKCIQGHTFLGWGTNTNIKLTSPYLTCAASLGITERDIIDFIKKLGKILTKPESS